MTKANFISAYAERTGESKKRAGELVDAFLENVTDVLVAKDAIQFTGWGTFKTVEAKSRKARNPKTGAEVIVPAKIKVKFTVGKKLKELVK